jgi:hypothetical protein
MMSRDLDERLGQDILLRLDAIVGLLLDHPAAEATPSTAAKILRLIDLGFAPPQIAALVRKPPNYVSAVIADSKKRKTRRTERKRASG